MNHNVEEEPWPRMTVETSNLASGLACLRDVGQVIKDESFWDLSFLISKMKTF